MRGSTAASATDPPSRLQRLAGDSRVALGAAAVLLAVCLAWHIHWLSVQWISMVGGDAHVYVEGGHRVLTGHRLYDPVPPRTYFPLLFTYPPFAALLFAGIEPLSWNSLKLVIETADVAFLLVCVWMSLRLSGQPRTYRTLALTLAITGPAFWLEPVHWTEILGQVNLMILAMILTDLNLSSSSRWKGVLLGLATAIKLTPGLFVVYLLLTRQIRAAVTAIGTFVVTLALGAVALPHDSVTYWTSTVFDSRRIGPPNFGDNQSLTGVLARYMHVVTPPKAASLSVSTGIILLGMAISVLAFQRGHLLLSVIATGETALLASPISWSHHWVWIVPVFVVMISGAMRAERTLTRIAAWALIVAAWWVLTPTKNGGLDVAGRQSIPVLDLPAWFEHLRGLHSALNNAFVLSGLLCLVAIACYSLLAPRVAK